MAQAKPAAVAAAAPVRPRGDRKKVVIWAVVAVVLVGVVVGGYLYYDSQKNATEGQEIQAASWGMSDATYPVRREDSVVVVGADSAEVTLDVYEDFLCPACRSFEEQYAGAVEEHIADGTLQVRYHMLPMLNDRSDPAGYSMDAANAGLCAADAGVFPRFHASLFTHQPEENARGWDKQQLTDLGVKQLDVTDPAFRTCIAEGTYNSAIQAHFDEVRETRHLEQDFDGQRGFGTPTLAADEKVVKISDPKWLDNLLSEN
jgi:protein-disulfide isomerase